MTLEELYIETASYTDETIAKSSGIYTPTDVIAKFKSGINTAYKKICREKYRLRYGETVTFVDGKLNVSTLTNKFFKLIDVRQDNGVVFSELQGDTIVVDPAYTNLTVNYYFIPAELTSLTDAPVIPDSNVDHKILCYYAAFHYFNIQDDDRASKWLSLWNDAFDSIEELREVQTQVKSVYNAGW